MTTDADAEAEELSPTDRAALELAIERYRAGSRWQRETVDALFARGDSWEEVADYCAFHCQCERLGLPPWQPPPCRVHVASALKIEDPVRGYRAAALLRQRMERCGVSKWHPDPARECDRVEAEVKHQPPK
jgi:hypothetical protein